MLINAIDIIRTLSDLPEDLQEIMSRIWVPIGYDNLRFIRMVDMDRKCECGRKIT